MRSFHKAAEGGFNRVFKLTMADGFQVIARLPYRSTRPKALATASEVATMDLARHYGIPTPLVYGCSTDSDNPVGSEYIIMEKIPGQCLGNTWDHLADEERVTLLENIVNLKSEALQHPCGWVRQHLLREGSSKSNGFHFPRRACWHILHRAKHSSRVLVWSTS